MGWDSRTFQFQRYKTRYTPSSGGNDPFAFDSYSEKPATNVSYSNTTNATWFMRNWWGYDRIAKKFYNDTGMPVKLSGLSFVACAGHSGGQSFMTSTGGIRTVGGYGCNFFIDIYVSDGQKLTDIHAGSVPAINAMNCSYNGVKYTTSSANKGTRFGSDLYKGESSGGKLCLSDSRIKLDLSNVIDQVPVVPVGGTMMVHAYAKNEQAHWTGGDANNSLLVIKFDGSVQGTGTEGGSDAFQPELKPEPTDYIWIRTEAGWEKKRMAYIMTNSGWELLKGD